jgi:adenosylcobinamide-GDP ribazoletransferase
VTADKQDARSAEGSTGGPDGLARTLGDALRLTFGTLTAVRVTAPRRIDRRVGALAMILAPLAGLVPGLTAGAVAWGVASAGGAPLLAAALALGAATLVTRGLHLDGLADTADGLSAAYDRDRALDVMRRGDTGPAGAAALVLVLLVQVAALAQAIDRHGPVAVVVAVVAGRTALAIACRRGVPSARPEGLGATVAGSVHPAAVLLGPAVTAAAAWSAIGDLSGAAAVGAAAVAVLILLARSVRRLGGVTGDVLGACVETATTTAAVTLALLP